MRTYSDNTWSSLRLGTYSSYLGLLYATLPIAQPWLSSRAECYARSQLGYIFGDTGRSYVVGSGKNWPKQVHHREAACTLKEDAAGKCDRCDAALVTRHQSDDVFYMRMPEMCPWQRLDSWQAAHAVYVLACCCAS